jgi:ubiquinone/menaquinone biosynthesis C-methylase UbiE
MPVINDKKFYEALWARFSGEHALQVAIHLESRRPLLKLLARSVPKERAARFLEVGCGTALDTSLLVQTCPEARAYALDLSVNALAVAQKNAKELVAPVYLLAADLATLPFPDSAFDLVFSQGVLEHFADPSAAMLEQVRVLKPGGVLVVDVPQKYNVYTLRKHAAMRANRWPWGWETEYSVGELRAWAPRFGLEAFDAVGYQHGRWLDRLVIHPHRFVRRKLRRWNGQSAPSYQPGRVARAWESAWDWVDARVGPYLAINVAVAFRKPK